MVVVHGTAGFERSYLGLARDLADAGFLTLAGCWFRGSHGRGRTTDYIPCPDAPDFGGANLDAAADVRALIEAARTLPETQPDRVGLFGHSRGGQVSLLVGSTGGPVQAMAVSAGAGSPDSLPGTSDVQPITLVGDLQPPLLLLHGTEDTTVPVEIARGYEAGARAMDKRIETYYYPGAQHLLPFQRGTAGDVRQRAIAFFRQHLGD